MGSLMPGWDSPVLEQSEAMSERNMSLTKEEIQRFWEINKLSEYQEQHHPQPALTDSDARMAKSSSMPIFTFPRTKCHVDLEKACSKDDWWTRSNWAFLNEKPQEDLPKSSSSYNSQFHIARLATAN